jgi:hypothetical protein
MKAPWHMLIFRDFEAFNINQKIFLMENRMILDRLFSMKSNFPATSLTIPAWGKLLTIGSIFVTCRNKNSTSRLCFFDSCAIMIARKSVFAVFGFRLSWIFWWNKNYIRNRNDKHHQIHFISVCGTTQHRRAMFQFHFRVHTSRLVNQSASQSVSN